MKNQLTTTALSAAIALTVVACGPSGSGGLAGIGGSGYVSSGSVTGFGSVFVNGVEFETDSATFDVDGNSGTQDDLAIGMIVRVSGSINDDGVTGTATAISFDDELQGPVSLLSVPDADGIKRSFSVLGTTVIIDSGSTTFDVSGDLPANTVFDFDTIRNNNNVEVSGFFDSNGDIQATRVELKNVDFDANSIVEVKGVIANLSSTDFVIGSVNVDASSAMFDDLPNGLADGQLVEVKGTYDSVSNTITATKVEAEDELFEDSDEFELEGLVSGYTDINSTFKMGSVTVDASNATLEPATLSLANDLRIEAEGAIVNGILIASEIELEGGEIKVHANVTSVDVDSSTFILTPVTGQDITVTVTTDTQLQDDVDEIEPYTLVHLFNNPGFVEVQGFENDTGGITATEVEVKDPGDVIVQGYLQSIIKDVSITVLGVSFQIDDTPIDNGETDFENAADVGITQDQFIKAAPVGTLVKVKDRSDQLEFGTADEIDIE